MRHAPERRALIADPLTPFPGQETPHARWLVRVWMLVALFAAITLIRSHQVGIGLRDPHGAILRNKVLISLGLLVVLAIVDAVVRTPRSSRTRPGEVGRVLRARWTRRRLSLTLSALLAYHLVYFCYHNLKSWVAFRPLRDQLLERWDHWLFLGHSPAVLLHDLLGQHAAAYVLMVFYESFTTIVSISLVASLVFVERIEKGYVFITSAMWAWILGVGSYYLLPTIGPFHQAPGDFAGLPHTMIQDTQAKYVAQRTYLLAHPHAHDAFAQLGAFASLHVAMTTLVLLMARYYGLRRTARALVVFVAITMVATVYLGWHYVVDDVAGVAIAVISVALGRAMIGRGRTQVREQAPAVELSV